VIEIREYIRWTSAGGHVRQSDGVIDIAAADAAPDASLCATRQTQAL